MSRILSLTVTSMLLLASNALAQRFPSQYRCTFTLEDVGYYAGCRDVIAEGTIIYKDRLKRTECGKNYCDYTLKITATRPSYICDGRVIDERTTRSTKKVRVKTRDQSGETVINEKGDWLVRYRKISKIQRMKGQRKRAKRFVSWGDLGYSGSSLARAQFDGSCRRRR